jgi:glycosyltransferase involved in cell wall biosynthesis
VRTVLHYVDSNAFGGTEQTILTLLASLDRSRWRAVLAHHADPGLALLLQEIRRLEIKSCALPRLQGRSAAHGILEFYRLLRTERPAVFHAHMNWPFACARALALAALARIPAVTATLQVFPRTLEPARRYKQQIAWSGVDRFLAVSDHVADGLTRVFGIASLKVRVVRNGIVIATYQCPAKASLRASLLKGPQRGLVLTVGRLHEQKGHRYLLEAATKVPNATFVFAGDGPLREDLEAQARTLNLGDRVVFLGHRDDVAELLAACDIFVLPSLFEGYPLSVMEAAAAGKPIVATNVGGTDEAIQSGENGLLVPSADPDALAQAINDLLRDPIRAEQLATSAKLRAQTEFSADTMWLRTVAIYDEVLASRKPRHD